MLTLLGIVAALAVLFVAASVATRDGEVLVDAPRDRADLDLPTGALQPADIGALRLGMALRGYRMSEVDDVLDRMRAELALRDARLLELQEELAASAAPARPDDLAMPSLHAAIDPTVAPLIVPPPAPDWQGGIGDDAAFGFPDVPAPERAGGPPSGVDPAAAADSGP